MLQVITNGSRKLYSGGELEPGSNYGSGVQCTTNQFTEDAEASLKEAIAESKETFMSSK